MAAFFFALLQVKSANCGFRRDGKFYFQGGNLCYKKQNTLQSGCPHFCWQSLSPQAPASPAASLSMPQTALSSIMPVHQFHTEAILLPE